MPTAVFDNVRSPCTAVSLARRAAGMTVIGWVLLSAWLCLHAQAGVNPAEGWRLELAQLTPANRFANFNGVKLIRIKDGTKPEMIFKIRTGQVEGVPLAAIISATRPDFSNAAAGAWQVFLKDGGWIIGRAVTSRGQNFHIQTPAGRISVPLNDALGLGLRAIDFKNQHATAHDRLILTGGSAIKGTFMVASKRGVEMHSSLGTQWTPWSKIAAVILGGLPARSSAVPMCSVALLNGSQLDAKSLRLSGDVLTVHTVIGLVLQLPLSAVGQITPLGGNVVWLSSLQPKVYRQTPLFGRGWPLGRNRNAVGGILRVDGTLYAHGVGLHAPCQVSYQLAGGYQYLLFAAQMDDSGAMIGRGQVTILIDGHEVYKSRVLSAGLPLRFVKLQIKGARTLTISARSTSYLATRCRIDLLDAALLR